MLAAAHIYAPNGIITHGLLTLSAITAQPFLSLWQEILPAESIEPARWTAFRMAGPRFPGSGAAGVARLIGVLGVGQRDCGARVAWLPSRQ
jgi:hypothetical protein